MRWITCMALLAIGPASAWADRFELADGRKLDGRIVVEVDGQLSIETERGTVIVKRADVRRVLTDVDLRRELSQRIDQAHAQPDAARGEAYLAAAAWAEEYPPLRERAGELYAEAARADPELADLADVRLLALAIAQRRWDEGQRIARAALARNPNHERVAELARGLEEEAVAVGIDRLAPLIDAYKRRRYDRVIVLAHQLLSGLGEVEIQAISKELERRAGTSLADVLVDCRFNGICKAPRCEGGLIKCARCEGSGRETREHRPVEGLGGVVVNKTQSTHWCTACDGLAYQLCDGCRGTGLAFGKPLPFETPRLVEALLGQAKQARTTLEQLLERASKLDSNSLDLRSADSYGAMGIARQAAFFLERAIELHPQLGSPLGQNLGAQVKEIHSGIAAYLSSLATRYYERADALYAEALDVRVDQEGWVAGMASRRVKLQQALELATESRRYLVQILRDDPSAKGFLKGNYERRRQLSEAFIERCQRAVGVFNKLENMAQRGGGEAGRADDYREQLQILSRQLRDLLAGGGGDKK